MGKEKTTQQTDTTQTIKHEPTAEEREFNQLALERERAAQPGQIEAQGAGLDLINQLLRGELPSGDLFQQIGGIGPEMTQDISQAAIRDLLPSFQGLGILESGTAASIAGRTAGDIRRGVAEFNVGAGQNLLNLAFGGQAQVQQPLLAQSAMLGGQLAGLRSTTTTGTSRTQLTQMNPFLKSFQQSLGSSLGGGIGGGIAGGLPGFGAGGRFGGG